MNSRIYVFNNPERDNSEFARHLASAVMKQATLDDLSNSF